MTNQTNEPQEYSLTELDNAVANGAITQQQRDQMFAAQVERKAVKTATEAATQAVESHTQENNLDTQLQQYAAIAPDLMKDGSPLRARVASEFEFLVSQGLPRNLTTELAAARAVMGPVERARQSVGRRRDADAYADSSNSRLSPAERRQEDAFSKLEPGKRAHYEKLINMGMYASKGAVIAELNWTRGSKPNQRGRA